MIFAEISTAENLLVEESASAPGLGGLLASVGFTCAAFLIFAAILAFPLFLGKKLKRKCACAASKEAVRLVEEREKAAYRAKLYNPKTVNTVDLPQADPTLVEYSKPEPKKTV